MLKHIALALILTSSLAACGSDEESKPADTGQAGTVNTQAVEQAATTAFQATETAISSADGEAAAFQMLSVGTSALSIVTPSSGGTPQSVGSTSQALGAGTCDCTANACNFVDCGDDISGWIINGTIDWTDSSLNCDYSVTGQQTGFDYTFDIQCALTYTASSLDGTLNTAGSYDGSAQGQNVSVAWDSDLTFNNVSYAGGSPTGGSIDVSASVTLAGQMYTASETVDFGG